MFFCCQNLQCNIELCFVFLSEDTNVLTLYKKLYSCSTHTRTEEGFVRTRLVTSPDVFAVIMMDCKILCISQSLLKFSLISQTVKNPQILERPMSCLIVVSKYAIMIIKVSSLWLRRKTCSRCVWVDFLFFNYISPNTRSVIITIHRFKRLHRLDPASLAFVWIYSTVLLNAEFWLVRRCQSHHYQKELSFL